MQMNCLNFLEPRAQGRLFFTLILISVLTLVSERAFRFGACRFNSQKAEASIHLFKVGFLLQFPSWL